MSDAISPAPRSYAPTPQSVREILDLAENAIEIFRPATPGHRLATGVMLLCRYISSLEAELAGTIKQYTCQTHREEVLKGGPCAWCALAEARELERERCAKIAELRRNMFGGEFTTDNEKLIVDHIAAAIRKGGET